MELIRELDLADLEQIISLRIGIQNYDFRDVDSIILDSSKLESETAKYLLEHLNKDLFLLGYFIDDKLVANCGFYVDKHFPTYSNPTGLIGYICNVFTLEDYRGRGYQKELFQKCLDLAKDKRITTFKLSSKNEYAIAMYKSFGFFKDEHEYKYKV